MLTRIALYAVLGTALDAMGHSVTSWQFWCIVGLFWAAEHLTRIEVIEDINEQVERIKKQRKENNK